MSGLSVQQSKQGGNNAARFICKSARLAVHSSELLELAKQVSEGWEEYKDLQDTANALIKKIEAG